MTNFFNAFYATVPGISCLPNPFNGKYIGWIGGVLVSIYAPILFGILLFIIFITTLKLCQTVKLKKLMSFYCFVIFILQFPLSGLSLNILACKFDIATNNYYMISQPWQQCSFKNIVQISGIIGVVIYFFGVPIALNYLYWNKCFDTHFQKELEGLIVPSGTKFDVIFIIFTILRGMILVVIIIMIPVEWDIRKLLIILLFLTNILLVVKRVPYFPTKIENVKEQYLINEESELVYNMEYLNCLLFLKKSHEGN